jgi:hypothetical protein
MAVIIDFSATIFGATVVDPETDAYFKSCKIQQPAMSGKGFTSLYFKYSTGKEPGGSDDTLHARFAEQDPVYDPAGLEGEFYMTTDEPADFIVIHLESSALATAYDLNFPWIEIIEICEEDIP